MTAFMGGIAITAARWVGSHELLVRFSSTYGITMYYQLYAGRSLVGVTESKSARSIVGTFKPSEWPQHITLLVVSSADRLTDFGSKLPDRPFNKIKLRFSASSWPADAEFIDITAGTVPGGAVDSSNLLERILYDTDREYEVVTDPLAGTGTWNIEAAGRDNRLPDGNVGTPLALSQSVKAHPPDLVLDSNDNRFSLDIAGQIATFTFTAS